MELGIMEEHGSGNPEDLNDFGKDGEEDDFCLLYTSDAADE